MRPYKIVFSDIDGTLLNSQHRVTELTRKAILSLEKKQIPFAVVSARSPSGIYPILDENGFRCPLICYSGSLILDENRKPLFHDGMSRQEAGKLIRHMENWQGAMSWCLYSLDRWIVKDTGDPRIIREEQIVQAKAEQGTAESLPEDAKANKVLCICDPEKTLEIEADLKKNFSCYSIVKSSDILIEVMNPGTTKAKAVKMFCGMRGIAVEEAMAFGDHYNDLEMLREVGCGILMGNAPAPLKQKIERITLDNDHDGIYHGLLSAGMTDEIAQGEAPGIG